MKKLLLTLAAMLAAGTLVCHAQAATTVKVGASPTPHAEILNAAKDMLKAEGINLEIIEYSDYVQPNVALDSKDLDANYFQHKPYLDDFNAQKGTKLSSMGGVHYEPFGIYAGKCKSLKDLKKGAIVAVPNDATNEGRALKLLEAAGVLKLRKGAGASPELSDIESTCADIDFVEMDANLIVSTLPDVALAAVNGNYALDSGLTADEAIFKEPKYDDDSYTCLIASRAADAQNPVYRRIVEAYQSQAVIDVFNTTFAGFFVPAWK